MKTKTPAPKKSAKRNAKVALEPNTSAPAKTVTTPPPPPIEDGVRQKISTKLIEPHAHNRTINRKDCFGLADSMKLFGQIQPATVRPHPKKPGHYQLGAGERRWHAAEIAGLDLDCIIRNLSDSEMETMLVTENHQRANPDPREEATQIRRMFESHPNCSASDIAAMMGQTETWARRRMRLLSLTDKVHTLWIDPHKDWHSVSVATMELVATLPADQQHALLQYFNQTWNRPRDEPIQKWIKDQACSLKGATWLDDERTFIQGCGPGCASSSTARDLFSSTEFADQKSLQCAQCLKPECFKKRKEKARQIAWQEATDKAPQGYLAANRTYSKEVIELANKTKITLQPKHEFDSWKPAKKTDEGAQAILMESDAGNVTTVWKKAPPLSGAQQTARLASPAARTEEQTRSASIERLQAKRYDHVLGQLREHFEQAENPFPIDSHRLIAFAAVFGTDEREAGVRPVNWQQFMNLADSEDISKVHKALWDQVHGIISRRMQDARFTHRKSDLLQNDFQAEMKAIASLTNFDMTTAYATAAKACPPPKSLGEVDPLTLKKKAKM